MKGKKKGKNAGKNTMRAKDNTRSQGKRKQVDRRKGGTDMSPRSEEEPPVSVEKESPTQNDAPKVRSKVAVGFRAIGQSFRFSSSRRAGAPVDDPLDDEIPVEDDGGRMDDMKQPDDLMQDDVPRKPQEQRRSVQKYRDGPEPSDKPLRDDPRCAADARSGSDARSGADLRSDRQQTQQKIRTATANLKNLLKDQRRIRLECRPRLHYLIQQSFLTAFTFFNYLRRKALDCFTIRDCLCNLGDLHELSIKKRDTISRDCIAALLNRLLLLMADVAAALETRANEFVTDWKRVAEAYPEKDYDPSGNVAAHIPDPRWFKTEKVIGEGGFGVVTKVSIAKGVILTVKMVPSKLQDKPKFALVDKVVACSTNHPLIVKYYSCFVTRLHHVTIMEYIRGIDLYRAIKETTDGMSHNVRRVVAAQLALALQYIHEKGFIHRDIKPTNALFTPGCFLKLIDFDTVKIGMGKFTRGRFREYLRRSFREFTDRETAGTTGFIPSEVLEGRGYGRAVDWFAYGATFFQMCYKKLPFRDKEEAEVENLIKKGKWSFPNDCPVRKEERIILEKLLRKFAKDRLGNNGVEDLKAEAYFADVDWPSLEAGQSYLEWKGFADVMPVNADGQLSVKADKKLRDANMLETMSICDDLTPLYTFSSPGLLSVMPKLRNRSPVTADDLYEEPDWLLEDVKIEYKFKNFLLR